MIVPVEFFPQIPDPPNQIALPGLAAKREALAALKDHFDHVARFRGFDAGKCFFAGSPSLAIAEIKRDQRLVNLHPVLHEGNLELFALQAAAQRLKRLAGLQIGAARRLPVAPRASDLPFEEMRVINEHGRLKPRELGKGRARLLVGRREIIHLESNLGQQKMGQHGFSRKRR